MAWAPPYATTADLRAFMRVDAVDDMDAADVLEDSAVYGPAIEAASREIDKSANRQFGNTDTGEAPAAVERSYVAWYSPHEGLWFVTVDDITDTDDLVVTVDGTDVADDCTLLPLNAVANGRAYTVIQLPTAPTDPLVVVGAHYGWTAFPATIVNGTLIQAARLVKRRDAPFGVAGSPDMGNELRLLARLDPDVEVMIRAYRRYW